MKIINIAAGFSLISLFLSTPVFSQNTPLSMDEGMRKSVSISDSCQTGLGLTKSQCDCVYAKTLDSDISNYDISLYYTKDASLSSAKRTTADKFVAECSGTKHSTSAPVTTPTTDEAPEANNPHNNDYVSQNMEQCLAGSLKLDKPRCECLLQSIADKNYSENDVKWFFKGKSSKVSEFSIYSDISKVVWECESSVVQKETRAKYRAKYGTGTTGDTTKSASTGGTLKRLPNASPYGSLVKIFLNDCPRNYRRDTSFCECVADKSWPYLSHPDFQAVTIKNSIVLNSIQNSANKDRFIRNVEAQCSKTYHGKIWSQREAAEWYDEHGSFSSKPRNYKGGK